MLSEEKTLAIKQFGYQNWERTIQGIRREEKTWDARSWPNISETCRALSCQKGEEDSRHGSSPHEQQPKWKRDGKSKHVQHVFFLNCSRSMTTVWPSEVETSSSAADIYWRGSSASLPVWQGMTSIGIAGKKVSPKCQRVGSIHMPVLPPSISGQ